MPWTHHLKIAFISSKTVRRTAGLTLAMVAAMTMAAPAMAACGVTAEAVAKAPVVFVGLLTEVSADGNNATFTVEEIWHGGGLVVGKGVGIDTTNSLQRLELPPVGAAPSLYLVLANTVDGQLHTGDSCEIFPFPWADDYAAFRPPDAPTSTSDGGVPGALIAVGAALLVLAVVGVVAFSVGRATDD